MFQSRAPMSAATAVLCSPMGNIIAAHLTVVEIARIALLNRNCRNYVRNSLQTRVINLSGMKLMRGKKQPPRNITRGKVSRGRNPLMELSHLKLWLERCLPSCQLFICDTPYLGNPRNLWQWIIAVAPTVELIRVNAVASGVRAHDMIPAQHMGAEFVKFPSLVHFEWTTSNHSPLTLHVPEFSIVNMPNLRKMCLTAEVFSAWFFGGLPFDSPEAVEFVITLPDDSESLAHALLDCARQFRNGTAWPTLRVSLPRTYSLCHAILEIADHKWRVEYTRPRSVRKRHLLIHQAMLVIHQSHKREKLKLKIDEIKLREDAGWRRNDETLVEDWRDAFWGFEEDDGSEDLEFV
eukprot:Gregarina_sp_Poly_1__10666@NODE_803_length_6231_cov_277_802239_g586_i0_p4_GENE_NODE_803_length_6231_cov_277_802239_g586_i0NODE_803_length_6231_cov_277_802239_g586_i0_p4_ORF_typecomplete_len350_score36_35_NODE_803_length_6231_cov_277_802239_g586_i050566105